ncbi:MAG: hypothetical protein Q9164_003128, partial [Protoblastenia rupestris]
MAIKNLSDTQVEKPSPSLEKGAQVASQYAKAGLIYGLDDAAVLEEEARKADIVLNYANADHEAAAQALISGLAAADRDGCHAYLIHTSGTGILSYKNIKRKTLGDAATKVYGDLDGVEEITSLPDFAPYRVVDKLLIEANGPSLQTAI